MTPCPSPSFHQRSTHVDRGAPFPHTPQALASPSTTVLYATTPRYRDEWQDLEGQFEKAGFEVGIARVH